MKKIVVFINNVSGKKFFALMEKETDPMEWVEKNKRDSRNEDINHPFFIDYRRNPENFDYSVLKEGKDVNEEDLRNTLKNYKNLYFDYLKINEGVFKEIEKGKEVSKKELAIGEVFWGFNNAVKKSTEEISSLFGFSEGEVIRIIDKIVNTKPSKNRPKVFWEKNPKREFQSFRELSNYVFKTEKYGLEIEKVVLGLEDQFKGEKFHFVDSKHKQNFQEKAKGIMKNNNLPVRTLSEKYNLKRAIVKEVLRRGGKIKEKQKEIPVIFEKDDGETEKYTSIKETAKELLMDPRKTKKVKDIIENKKGYIRGGRLKYSEENLLKTNEQALKIFDEAKKKVIDDFFYKETKTLNQTKDGFFYKKIVFNGKRKFLSVVFFESKVVLNFSDQEKLDIRHNNNKNETIEKINKKMFDMVKDNRVERRMK